MSVLNTRVIAIFTLLLTLIAASTGCNNRSRSAGDAIPLVDGEVAEEVHDVGSHEVEASESSRTPSSDSSSDVTTYRNPAITNGLVAIINLDRTRTNKDVFLASIDGDFDIVTEVRYKIVPAAESCGPISSYNSLQSPSSELIYIPINDFSDGSYVLCALAGNKNGQWQSDSLPTEAAFAIDRTGPSDLTFNKVEVVEGGLTSSWVDPHGDAVEFEVLLTRVGSECKIVEWATKTNVNYLDGRSVPGGDFDLCLVGFDSLHNSSDRLLYGTISTPSFITLGAITGPISQRQLLHLVMRSDGVVDELSHVTPVGETSAALLNGRVALHFDAENNPNYIYRTEIVEDFSEPVWQVKRAIWNRDGWDEYHIYGDNQEGNPGNQISGVGRNDEEWIVHVDAQNGGSRLLLNELTSQSYSVLEEIDGPINDTAILVESSGQPTVAIATQDYLSVIGLLTNNATKTVLFEDSACSNYHSVSLIRTKAGLAATYLCSISPSDDDMADFQPSQKCELRIAQGGSRDSVIEGGLVEGSVVETVKNWKTSLIATIDDSFLCSPFNTFKPGVASSASGNAAIVYRRYDRSVESEPSEVIELVRLEDSNVSTLEVASAEYFDSGPGVALDANERAHIFFVGNEMLNYSYEKMDGRSFDSFSVPITDDAGSRIGNLLEITNPEIAVENEVQTRSGADSIML